MPAARLITASAIPPKSALSLLRAVSICRWQDNALSEGGPSSSSSGTGQSYGKICDGKNCNFAPEGRPITKACGDDSRAGRPVNNEGAIMIIGIFKLLCRGYLVVALVVALCALVGLSLNRTPSLSRTRSRERPDAQMPKVLWYCVVKGISWPRAIDYIGFSHEMSFMDWLLNRYDPWGGQVLDKIGRGRVRTALICDSLDQRCNCGPHSSS
jgi:hypothetical protein